MGFAQNCGGKKIQASVSNHDERIYRVHVL